MNALPHVGRFRVLPGRAEAHSPHALEAARERVFWVLAVAKDEMGYLTPAQIADILCDGEGIQVSRQQVSAILRKERGTVARRKIGGKEHYKIMRAGEEALSAGQSFRATLIDPAKSLSEIRKLEELLSGLTGGLRVCDPYVDKKTLDLLAECRKAQGIELMTVNLQKENTFRRDLEAFRREHTIPLAVRVSPHAKLHDRYIIHNQGTMLLGGSLNGIGKKQSFIVELGIDLRSAINVAFDKEWRLASIFS